MKVAFIDLEFETNPARGVALGDIASSLVCLHDLLRDLSTIAAYSSGAEFRDIRVVAIEAGSPLKIKLSLHSIPAEAVKAFQEICRDVIIFRERGSREVNIKRALDLLSGGGAQITEAEEQRLLGHVATLQNVEVPLKRVVVRKE